MPVRAVVVRERPRAKVGRVYTTAEDAVYFSMLPRIVARPSSFPGPLRAAGVIALAGGLTPTVEWVAHGGPKTKSTPHIVGGGAAPQGSASATQSHVFDSAQSAASVA